MYLQNLRIFEKEMQELLDLQNLSFDDVLEFSELLMCDA